MLYSTHLGRALLLLGLFALCPIWAFAQEEKNLFPNSSFSAWSTVDGKPVPASWKINDGVIHLSREGERGGNIVTREEYADFILSFDFKIAPKGNSGIKYRVRTYDSRTLGFEYQVYDDTGAKQVASKNSTGAIYDLYEPNSDKAAKPAGQWNEAKIVARGTKLEHWLNGKRIVTATIGDSDWDKRFAESKFNDREGFGKTLHGRLMLTDHGSEVWYRNFRFEVITDAKAPASLQK